MLTKEICYVAGSESADLLTGALLQQWQVAEKLRKFLINFKLV